MVFHIAKLRVKELAEAISVDAHDIIATCIILDIPASTQHSSLTIEQCKEIIKYLKINNI